MGFPMCGRFVQYNTMESFIKIDHIASPINPNYNIAPSQQVSVIINQNDRIILDQFHWGLVPFWAKDKSIGNRMINAKMETIAEKPSFRNAFRKRRCLIPADGFYEWKGKAGNKQPYYITIPSDEPFAFVGIWEIWKKEDPPYRSCAIITTAASKSVQAVHHRMPVILKPECQERWLDPDFKDPLNILKDGMIRDMKYHPVSTKVNKASNSDPSCKDPIDL
jgi:putative SOS response-associated peptidase YedK